MMDKIHTNVGPIPRQVVAAIDFLHTRSILHRDIKDENIIIDHRFDHGFNFIFLSPFSSCIIQVFLQADRFWQCCLLQAWSEVPHILWHCRVLLPRSAAGYISKLFTFQLLSYFVSTWYLLQGCSYEGPELEMWSLGVLLYIIIFGENPFYDSQVSFAYLEWWDYWWG